jgi:4-hydroxy-2-oxoheptanedioate aldolase
VVCAVMVETTMAIDNVDEIMSVPGVDAVYIGPADLSVTLGLAPAPDHPDRIFTEALERVLGAARRHGVVPGIAGNADTAIKRLEQGFQMVEVASDIGLLGVGAGRALAHVRPDAGPAARSAYL